MLFSFIGKLALGLSYGSNSSRPKHVCLKMSSKISVPCQVGHLTVTEKGKQNQVSCQSFVSNCVSLPGCLPPQAHT